MPYIKQEDRKKYDEILNQIEEIDKKGDLEYIVYKILLIFMTNREYNYSNLHEAVYAAIHAGEEFKRRFLDVRENSAIEKNGDIT